MTDEQFFDFCVKYRERSDHFWIESLFGFFEDSDRLDLVLNIFSLVVRRDLAIVTLDPAESSDVPVLDVVMLRKDPRVFMLKRRLYPLHNHGASISNFLIYTKEENT